MSIKQNPQVCICMATFNGAKYIEEQLISFQNQTMNSWELIISDDGSTDNTLEILNNYAENQNLHVVRVSNGPQQGFAANFLSILMHYEGSAQYFAFSDQDDIWFVDKLERALKKLSNVSSDIPALYCSRTEFVNEKGEPFIPPKYSKKFSIKPSFENSLVQCLAGGNTMVFNRSAFDLITKANLVEAVPSHDWWLYQLISGCGGEIFYDPQPSVYYRQHSNNLIGSNTSLHAKLHRLKLFFNGFFATNNEVNLRNLTHNRNLLKLSSRSSLMNYSKACFHKRSLTRLYYYFVSKVRRQSFIENIILGIGILIKKI